MGGSIPSRRQLTMKPVFAVAFILVSAFASGCKTESLWADSQGTSGPPAVGSQTLPADGGWVRYRSASEHTTERIKGKVKFKDEGKEVESGHTTHRSELITLSFVGSAVEDGEPCRWVEIKTENADDNQRSILKVLVREKGFFDGKGPLASKNVVRSWKRKPDGSIVNVDDPPAWSLLFQWAPGEMKEMTSGGPLLDVDFQSGRLASATAWTMKKSDTVRPFLGLMKVRTKRESTVWMHPELPVGYARLQSADETLVWLGWGTEVKTSGRIEYTLDDAGTGAQSELPDCN